MVLACGHCSRLQLSMHHVEKAVNKRMFTLRLSYHHACRFLQHLSKKLAPGRLLTLHHLCIFNPALVRCIVAGSDSNRMLHAFYVGITQHARWNTHAQRTTWHAWLLLLAMHLFTCSQDPQRTWPFSTAYTGQSASWTSRPSSSRCPSSGAGL